MSKLGNVCWCKHFINLNMTTTDKFGYKILKKDLEVAEAFRSTLFSRMTKTKYTCKVRQLPVRIVREKCSWTILEGMILIKLHKEEENHDWTQAIKLRGVDQLNSDESS
ncbi:hypothetical protein RRG08_006299 [Elysia crispata]|uniref:CS domain-containing protein n=1 Tax=Elysia crispata TaxID=231223 RepID=A0AAE1D2J3_9GAST|nr:hypothetical protein RRG08_006299 [Elysia crispata]